MGEAVLGSCHDSPRTHQSWAWILWCGWREVARLVSLDCFYFHRNFIIIVLRNEVIQKVISVLKIKCPVSHGQGHWQWTTLRCAPGSSLGVLAKNGPQMWALSGDCLMKGGLPCPRSLFFPEASTPTAHWRGAVKVCPFCHLRGRLGSRALCRAGWGLPGDWV